MMEEFYDSNKNSLITFLAQKDLVKNYFPKEQIVFYLKALKYYGIDSDKEIKGFLINELNKKISEELFFNFYSEINNKKIGDVLEEIKKSNKYNIFINQLNKNIERGFVLSKHISDCNNILIFYNALTIEELNSLINV